MKRFSQLTQTASEADLVAGNFLAIDVPGVGGATKKLPGNLVAPRSVQDNLVANIAPAFNPSKANGADGYAYHVGDKVEYDGRFYIFTENRASGAWTGNDVQAFEIGLVANEVLRTKEISMTGISEPGVPGTIVRHDIYTNGKTKVTIRTPSSVWNMSNITTTGPNVFSCGYVDGNGVIHDVKQYTIVSILNHLGESIVLPEGYNQYYVCMRGNTGAVAKFFETETSSIFDVMLYEGNRVIRTKSVSIEGAGNSQVVLQFPVYGASRVSVKMPDTYPATSIPSGNYVFILGYYTAVTNDDSPRTTLASKTPTNISDITGKTITYDCPDTTKSLFIFARADEGETLDFDIEIEQQSNAESDGVSSEIRQMKIDRITKDGSITYGANRRPMYIEETNVNGGSIYYKCTNLVGRGRIDCGWNMSQMATALGVSLVTSPNGVTSCLEIASAYNLCIGIDGSISLKARSKLTDTDIIIVSCIDGLVSNSALDQYYFERMRNIENSLSVGGIPHFADYANISYAEKLAGVSGEVDTFLYFSDPHCVGITGGVFPNAVQTLITNIFTLISAFVKTNAVEKIICGGDILNSYDTQVEAMQKLGYFYGLSKKLVRDFWIAEGNHDTNYQGKLDAESADGTGQFSMAQQIASMFQDEGICYYSKQTTTTDYYILDTGLDSDWDMNAYRWEQVDWLANKLLTAAKAHGIVVMHIYARNANNWAGSIMPFGQKVQQLVSALNARTSVTLNGNTYDFSNATQKIAVILCGHTHIDYIDTDGDVPVMAITQTNHSPTFAVDACVVDYAAGKLYATRIGGYGSDRSVDIVV